MKIKSLKNQRAAGKNLEAGKQYDLPAKEAKQLLRMGRAEKVDKSAGKDAE